MSCHVCSLWNCHTFFVSFLFISYIRVHTMCMLRYVTAALCNKNMHVRGCSDDLPPWLPPYATLSIRQNVTGQKHKKKKERIGTDTHYNARWSLLSGTLSVRMIMYTAQSSFSSAHPVHTSHKTRKMDTANGRNGRGTTTSNSSRFDTIPTMIKYWM